MASSRSREIARASSKLATFAHAISKTRLTAPTNNHSVDWTSWTSRTKGLYNKSSTLVRLRVLLGEMPAGECQLGLRTRQRGIRP
jgi:hypothetical protein